MGERGGCRPSDRASDKVRAYRTGRRLALASVFEADFGQRTADAILERHLAEHEGSETAAALARQLVAAVVAHRDTIDATIERFAPQYPVVTLARIDRALLRCGVGEVLHSPTPARVAIAEWVELARSYSGDPMRRLVNGVLGRISAEADEATGSSGSQPSDPTPPQEGESVGHNVRPPQEDRR